MAGLLLAAEIGGLIVWRTGPEAKVRELEATKATALDAQNRLQGLGTQASNVVNEGNKLAPKFDFFKNVEEYNRTYPELYTRTAGYTYREAMYLDLQASNNQLRFNAYVTTPTDVARLMLGLSNSPDFQGLPRVTGVPNYSPEEEARRRAAAVAQTMPGSTIIGGFIPGQEGSGAYPGSYPGSEGMMPSDMGSYPGGDSGSYPGGDSGSYPGSEGYGSSGDSGEGSGGMGGQRGNLNAIRMLGATRMPKGFIVSVNCTLRKRIARPEYGDSARQLGGGTGGAGGYPGGDGSGAPGAYPGDSGGYPGGDMGSSAPPPGPMSPPPPMPGSP